MNVLEKTISHLASALDVPVSTSVPSRRPDSFVTVERAGGTVTAVDDTASLTVQVWDVDRASLEELADEVCDALLGMPAAVDGVMSVDTQKSYYPLQVNGYCPRYVIACTAYCTR